MSSDFLNKYFQDLATIFEGFHENRFGELVVEMDRAYQKDASIFVFGNGGSGSTASHFACDMNKGVSFGNDKRFKIICLNDNLPTLLAYANDVSYDDVFVEQMKNFIHTNDLVIGISGSGNSENVVRAINYANELGVSTFGICGFEGGRLAKSAQKALIVHSDDMQKVEDAHFIILHCAMQWFQKAYPVDFVC